MMKWTSTRHVEISIPVYNALENLPRSQSPSLQRCDKCPGISSLQDVLNAKFDDKDDDIEFKQWISVDRTQLVVQHLSVNEYITLLCEKMMNLVSHHFISHS